MARMRQHPKQDPLRHDDRRDVMRERSAVQPFAVGWRQEKPLLLSFESREGMVVQVSRREDRVVAHARPSHRSDGSGSSNALGTWRSMWLDGAEAEANDFSAGTAPVERHRRPWIRLRPERKDARGVAAPRSRPSAIGSPPARLSLIPAARPTLPDGRRAAQEIGRSGVFPGDRLMRGNAIGLGETRYPSRPGGSYRRWPGVGV